MNQKTLIFDIETDGFLEECRKIHSLVIEDVSTGILQSFADQRGYPPVSEGLKLLTTADVLVAHNGIGFDIPVIGKLFPEFSLDPLKCFDTLIASRLIWSDISDIDWTKIRAGTSTLPGNLAGSHKLEAWGYRLGVLKDEYKGGFEVWSQAMQDYCEQDVRVTKALLDLINSKNYSRTSLDLEMSVACICASQERHGFKFNVKAAEELYIRLVRDRLDLEEQLSRTFKPWFEPDGQVRVPKRPNKALGYSGYKDENGVWHGYPYTKIKLVEFNPNSRDHIAGRLTALFGWKPREFTPSGKPKVDDTILETLKWPETRALARYLMLQKRLGQLAEGDQAWLKLVKPDGRIRGRVITNGAVTGRATHSNPNIAQVPSIGVEYGPECRELFTVDPGNVLVGCDVSGLELRMLAHYMAKYDRGVYGREVVEGDVHWANVQALGLVPEGTPRDDGNPLHKIYRNGSKTFIYGFLYGAGGPKVASIVHEIGLEESKANLGDRVFRLFGMQAQLNKKSAYMIGERIKKDFLKRLPALGKLIDSVSNVKNLTGLDGRVLKVRSDYAALNTLLQSAGSLVCKRWLVEFDELLTESGIRPLVHQVAWVHDEIQVECPGYLGDTVGQLGVEAIKRAGKYFAIEVPLDGEYKIGSTWKETH